MMASGNGGNISFSFFSLRISVYLSPPPPLPLSAFLSRAFPTPLRLRFSLSLFPSQSSRRDPTERIEKSNKSVEEEASPGVTSVVVSKRKKKRKKNTSERSEGIDSRSTDIYRKGRQGKKFFFRASVLNILGMHTRLPLQHS